MGKKFTKGSWNHTSSNHVKCDFNTIAYAYSMNVGDEEAKANAKLIAAAPALLDACIKIAEYIELRNISDSEAYFIVKKAIKKATE